MAQEKSFIVLGLGRFGSTVANMLGEQGYSVIAIDREQDRVEAVSKYCQAARGDFSNIETLKAVGADGCDVGVVAVGSSLEDSIMAVMNLKELGVEHVVSKARDERCASVLYKVGADKVVQPEKGMAIKVSNMITLNGIADYIDIDNDYSIVEFKCPESWFGKTILELDLRRKYGFNIIGFKLTEDAQMYAHIDPNYVVKDNEYVVVIMAKKQMKILNTIK